MVPSSNSGSAGTSEAGGASEPTAILLIAHGSRRKEANDDLVRLADLVKERRPSALVEIAYLELTTPTILEGGRACVARGARRVLMSPFFLSAGAHATSDLQDFRDQLSAEHPAVEFLLCPPLGLHPLLVDVVLDRIAEGERGGN